MNSGRRAPRRSSLRICFAAALSVALCLSASRAAAFPAATCELPEPSFGIRLDEAGLNAAALSDVYIDGVFVVPVTVGVGMSGISELDQLVTRGIVELSVTDPDGLAVPGTVELVRREARGSSIGAGSPAWLVFHGAAAFTPNATYQVQFAFHNDQLSSCPEAVPTEGSLTFSTGTQSAAGSLVEPGIVSTALYPAEEFNPGCCLVTDAAGCTDGGGCIACWVSYYRFGVANFVANPGNSLDYFALDLQLLANDEPQPVTYSAQFAAGFSIVDAADEYCFRATLRPRAGGASSSRASTRCVAVSEFSGLIAPPLVALPVSGCTEASTVPNAEGGLLLAVSIGATEEEAKAPLLPPAMTAAPVEPKESLPPLRPIARGSACAFNADGRDHQRLFYSLALCALATRRRLHRRK